MSKEIKRAYTYEDEEMLVKAQVIHDHLVSDLASFTAAFPTITSATTTALQADITTAEALPLDNEVVDNLAVLTESVNGQVLLGRQALEELNNYARFTYPDQPKKQRVFGQDHWAAAYSDQEKMMNALEQAHNMVSSAPYASEMDANGYTAAKAANLQSIADEIHSRNLLQENAKANRPISTQGRIEQYNAVWNQLRPINIASKVVFANDPAKLEFYMLYPGSTSTTRVDVSVLNAGNALENAEVTILDSALAPQVTDAEGKCSFSSTALNELISLSVTHPDVGTRLFENQNIVPGATTVLALEM